MGEGGVHTMSFLKAEKQDSYSLGIPSAWLHVFLVMWVDSNHPSHYKAQPAVPDLQKYHLSEIKMERDDPIQPAM